MSTIIDKLNRLAQYKLDIKNSIISKGQTVGDNMSEFADAISKISSGVEIPEILDTDPLTFVKIDNTEIVGYISLERVNTTFDKTFQYNKNDEGWVDYSANEKIPLNYGDKLQFRSNSTISMQSFNFKTYIGSYICGGSIASLLNDDVTITLPANCFKNIFTNCNILTAPVLPFNNLGEKCYYGMFSGCNSLVNAPELPATTLANYCYSNMFSGCNSLVNSPELPATTLANYCYNGMFRNCTSIVNSPELPATTLADNCYYVMFQGCSSLVNAHALPATTLANYCYNGMFQGCSSLVNAPELHATTLANYCYNNMFSDCSSLVNAPALPATTLFNFCYCRMFSECTSLVTAPELPATTLADNCYNSMFYGCTSLVTAPELPATTLADNCYISMFEKCNSLVNAPKLPAITLAKNCYNNMFRNCTKLITLYCKGLYKSGSTNLTTEIGYNWLAGVPNNSSCTFYKNPNLTISKRGSSTVPSNWTILNWT